MKNIKRAAVLALASAMALGTVSTSFAAVHTVQKGDQLKDIAAQYGVSLYQLIKENKLRNPDVIRVGQELQIPDDGTAAAAVQSGKPASDLSALSVVTMDGKSLNAAFSPAVKSYEVRVQSDIYGILLKAEADGDIKVTADQNTYAYGKTEPSYKAGDEIAYDESYGGYLIPLDQSYQGYDSEFVQTVTVAANDNRKYTVKITRDNDSYIYAKFQALTFTDSNGTAIDYNLYVPTNYDSSRKYPVVLALHGSGQMDQPVDMILKRYQIATSFAKDSEAGHNQCIVIAPQAKKQWSVVEKYNDYNHPTGVPSEENIAAYELLQSVKENYSVDGNRIYLTGLSMGAAGAITMAYNHPEEFAALLADASLDFRGDIDYSRFAPLSGKIIYAQAEDDPVWPYESGKSLMNNWTKAGVKYDTRIYPSGTFFYPSAHFAWTPFYGDQSVRDFMFAQSK